MQPIGGTGGDSSSGGTGGSGLDTWTREEDGASDAGSGGGEEGDDAHVLTQASASAQAPTSMGQAQVGFGRKVMKTILRT